LSYAPGIHILASGFAAHQQISLRFLFPLKGGPVATYAPRCPAHDEVVRVLREAPALCAMEDNS